MKKPSRTRFEEAVDPCGGQRAVDGHEAVAGGGFDPDQDLLGVDDGRRIVGGKLIKVGLVSEGEEAARRQAAAVDVQGC